MSSHPNSNAITVRLPTGPYLTINLYCGGERINAKLHMGEHPFDGAFLFCACSGDQARIGHNAKSVWFADTAIDLGWHELREVADFLHLYIPQPELPAGQEVPR